MGHILELRYGIVAYVVFLGAFLYAIGFIAQVDVPKTINPSIMGHRHPW